MILSERWHVGLAAPRVLLPALLCTLLACGGEGSPASSSSHEAPTSGSGAQTPTSTEAASVIPTQQTTRSPSRPSPSLSSESGRDTTTTASASQPTTGPSSNRGESTERSDESAPGESAQSTPQESSESTRRLLFPPTLSPIFSSVVTGPHAYLGGIQHGPELPDGGRAILFGSGVELAHEAMSSDAPAGGVFAVHGTTNALIWETGTFGEIFTVPVFAEIAGTTSVLMAGRAGTFVQLDHRDGAPIRIADRDDYAETPVAYNFYTPALGHGLSGGDALEMIVVYGGDPTRPAFSPRDPSYIALVRVDNGDVLAVSETPDGVESYMSPILYRPTAEADPHILIGTGGETHGGSLWVAPVAALLDDTFATSAVALATSETKGFMAPPSLHDLNDDGYLDVIAVAHDGRTFAISGRDHSLLWTSTVEGAESYAVAALVRAPGGAVHVATQHLAGVFPNYSAAIHRLLDGQTGDELWRHQTDANALPSPVAADLKGDGYDAVIFLDTRLRPDQADFSRVHVLDTATLEATTYNFDAQLLSTPLISDSNGDGFLDLTLVASSGFGMPNPTRESMSWSLLRLDLNASADNAVSWGSYMGSRNDGLIGTD